MSRKRPLSSSNGSSYATGRQAKRIKAEPIFREEPIDVDALEDHKIRRFRATTVKLDLTADDAEVKEELSYEGDAPTNALQRILPKSIVPEAIISRANVPEAIVPGAIVPQVIVPEVVAAPKVIAPPAKPNAVSPKVPEGNLKERVKAVDGETDRMLEAIMKSLNQGK